MNRTEITLAVTSIAVGLLGIELMVRTRQFNRLRRAAIRLDEWSDVAQLVVKDAWEKHPELIDQLPEDIRVKMDFYNIIAKEDLF